MSIISPMDLETIFVVILAGSPVIFSFLAIILLNYLAAYFRMPNTITLFFMVLFGAMMTLYLEGVYVLLILLTGLATFYLVSRMIR